MEGFQINPNANGTITSEDLILYQYNPSNIAAYAFMGLFGFCTVAHLILMFPFRTAFFIPFLIGGIMEVGGYYGRAWAHDNVHNFSAFILQTLLLLVAPVFLAATVYMILGRVIRALDAEEHSMIRLNWLTKLFVFNDIICFVVQIMGAGMGATTSLSVQETGRKVVIAGLVFQILVFCWFILVTFRFHRNLKREPTEMSLVVCIRWKRAIWTIYAASVFILVRNLFRVIEYGEGANGSASEYEAYIYVFDATLMFLTMFIFVVFHPGSLIKAAKKVERMNTGDSEGVMKEADGRRLLGADTNYLHVPDKSGLTSPQSARHDL